MISVMDTLQTDSVFDALTPDLIFDAVEKHLGIFLDGSITPYNGYINRVFGLTDDEETSYIVKFYRPGRWNEDSIGDEHDFLFDCAELEIPVVTPLTGTSGYSVGSEAGYLFAVFPRCRARTFDITSDEGWIRTGSVIGRMHRAGKKKEAPDRLRCNPQETTERYIQSLKAKGLVHPDCLEDFSRICAEALRLITPLFGGVPMHRIHGDCHRGNILENSEGIILIDFDDMMSGPAVQDLWLLLSGHLSDSMNEMNLMLEGYEQFCEFDRSTLALVEPLRFMRHIYFLNWCATQHGDTGFTARFPDWGTKAFWIKETEDLSGQLEYIQNAQYT